MRHLRLTLRTPIREYSGWANSAASLLTGATSGLKTYRLYCASFGPTTSPAIPSSLKREKNKGVITPEIWLQTAGAPVCKFRKAGRCSAFGGAQERSWHRPGLQSDHSS